MSIEIKRSDKYVDYNISATNNRGYITIDTSDWINKPWMFYELPALKFEIYTETDGELVKYQNFTREIRTYNPVYSPLGVLNVTIDIRNVPEEFILRITPIFDNDAVAARNMLVENGIENGDIWGSDQDVPTQIFNLNLEFIECEGEYVPPTPPVPPTHEETITGVPPITFDGSTGEPLVSWTILGNGSQSGSPTPDNPVMPEFVGVRTGNLLDFNALKSANSGILIVPESQTSISVDNLLTINGEPNEKYTMISNGFGSTSGTADANRSVCFQTASGTNAVFRGHPVTVTTDNTGILKIGFFSSRDNATQYLNGGSHVWLVKGNDITIPYEPYGWAEKITCAGQTTPVYLGQVSTVRRIRKLVLTGNNPSAWTMTEQQQTGRRRVYLGGAVSEGENIGFICTHYAAASPNTAYPNNGYFSINASGTLIFGIANDGTKDEFVQFLADQYAAGNPVMVWYVLAEPTTEIINEPLCKIGTYADELNSTDAAVTIPTAEGQNTLTVDTDLQPSEMTITYIKEGQ